MNEQDQKIIKLDKVASKKLQFIQSACSTDDSRPVLNGINVNGNIASADGFRLHCLESIGNEEFEALEGTYQISKLKAGVNYLEPEEESGIYPEYDQICPKIEGGVMMSINPQFLLDICKYADKGEAIHLMLHGENKPMEVKGKVQGEEFYALIMPMHGYGKEGFYKAYAPHDTIPSPINEEEESEESTPQAEEIVPLKDYDKIPNGVCESCQFAATQDGADPSLADTICIDLGADIADHRCESLDGGGACACACT